MAIFVLTASTFNQLDQFAGNCGNKVYCCAELAASSPLLVVTIASIRYAFP